MCNPQIRYMPDMNRMSRSIRGGNSASRPSRRRPCSTTSTSQIRMIMMIISIIIMDVIHHPSSFNNNNHKNHDGGIISILPVVQGMKHTFELDHSRRTIIGPMGIPFGFNVNGFYQLTVSNFHLEFKSTTTSTTTTATKQSRWKRKKSNGNPSAEQTKMLEQQYEAGFYLQRYNTVASFHQHYNTLVNNIQNYYYNRTNGNSFGDDGTGSTSSVTPPQQPSIQDTCSFAHWVSEDILTNHGHRQLQRQSHQRMLLPGTNDDIDDGFPGLDDAIMDGGGDDFIPTGSSNSNYPNGDDDYHMYGGNDDADNRYSDMDEKEHEAAFPSAPTAPNNNNNDDEVIYQQNTVYTSAQPHGIYMSMHSKERMWEPNEPHINYTFHAYVLHISLLYTSCTLLMFVLTKYVLFLSCARLYSHTHVTNTQ